MGYFLKYSLLLLTITGLTVGSSFCSNKFVEDWMETAEVVQASVRCMFAKILNNSAILNDSLSNVEVYKLVATVLGVPVTSDGFDHFQETIGKVIVAKLATCSGSKKEKFGVDDISKLVANLTALIDAKNMSQVYSIYSKLLCLQELLDTAKSKRQVLKDPLESFYDSLNGIRLATIFGITDVTNLDLKPTLAFAVDDTGSMKEEITSVQKLIHSFIQTERSEPHAYILTTFNDPSMYIKFRLHELLH